MTQQPNEDLQKLIALTARDATAKEKQVALMETILQSISELRRDIDNFLREQAVGDRALEIRLSEMQGSLNALIRNMYLFLAQDSSELREAVEAAAQDAKRLSNSLDTQQLASTRTFRELLERQIEKGGSGMEIKFDTGGGEANVTTGDVAGRDLNKGESKAQAKMVLYVLDAASDHVEQGDEEVAEATLKGLTDDLLKIALATITRGPGGGINATLKALIRKILDERKEIKDDC